MFGNVSGEEHLDRILSSRTNRRRMLLGVMAVGSSAAASNLLAACGGDDDTDEVVGATPVDQESPSDTPTSAPGTVEEATPDASDNDDVESGGTLVSMVVAEPTSMDLVTASGQHDYSMMCNVIENLLYWDEDNFDVLPGLAESYEISEDGLAYTFTLRSGVKFHDGTEMDAEAVRFTYSRALDPDDEFYQVAQPSPLMAFWYSAIDPKQTEVHDERTVTLKLSYPFSTLLTFFAWPAAGIVSPTAVRQHLVEFRENPVGTGPFKFESWEHNRQVTFSRFDDYWGDNAFLDSLIFRPIIEEQTRVTELLSGNLDFGYDLPPDNVAQVQANEDLHFFQTPLGHVWFLTLNTAAGPTADVRVRRAIAHAIDKDVIINDILRGWGVSATGPVPSVLGAGYNGDVRTYDYDPSMAQELLTEAGYPDGFEAKFWVTQSGSGMQSPIAMGEAIQAMLGQVGIQAQIEVFEWGAYLDAYAQGLPDNVFMAELSWFTTDEQNIANQTVTCRTIPPAGYNAGYYCDERVDELLAQFYASTDQDERVELIHELQDIVAEDVPNIYINSQIAVAALSKEFTGMSLHPSQLLRFWKTRLA